MQTRPGTSPARLAAVLAGGLLAVVLPAAGGADPTSTYLDRARALRDENASLAQQSSAAVLGLFALDSQIARTRATLERLRSRAEALRRKEQETRLALRLAERALRVSRQQLAERLRVLYQQGETDSLAVLLGAESLDDALMRIEELDRTARLNESVISQTLAARKALRALVRSLDEQRAAVRRMVASAEASAARLERARAERASYLASLAEKRELNTRQISSLEAAAAAARQRSATLVATPPSTPEAQPEVEEAAPMTAVGQTLTVTASGYSLQGHTASGIPVGWGVIAVDPSVIPLGTAMTIPGYGGGVAADIGTAVHGAQIDLWFPTPEQALAWGRRTVTITLH